MSGISKLLSAVALAAVLPSLALASEKRIAENKVPKPVMEAAKQKYPAAKMTGFEEQHEGKQVTYEIKLQDGSTEKEAVFTADGKPVSEESVIAADAVPENVKQALSSSKHGKAKLEKAEKVVFAGKENAPQYEITVSEGGKRAEVVFDHEGKIVKEEAAEGKPAGKHHEHGDGMKAK